MTIIFAAGRLLDLLIIAAGIIAGVSVYIEKNSYYRKKRTR